MKHPRFWFDPNYGGKDRGNRDRLYREAFIHLIELEIFNDVYEPSHQESEWESEMLNELWYRLCKLDGIVSTK